MNNRFPLLVKREEKMYRFALLVLSLSLLVSACAPGLLGPTIDDAPGVTANASQLTRITSYINVSAVYSVPSPDGSRILLTTDDLWTGGSDAYSLVLIDTSRPDQQQPVAGPGAAFGAWFPDGSSIVYVNLQGQFAQLVRSSVAGGGVTFIGNNPFGEFDFQPSVSPDGSKIVFRTTMGGNYTIATVNANGTEFTTYVPGEAPRWHPSGNQIVFHRRAADGTHVFLMDMATGAVTQLTSGASWNAFPSWSPDGSRIVFASRRADGNNHIFVMNQDGSNITQLTQGNTQNTYPSWSRDNRIYFSSDAGSGRFMNVWRLVPVPAGG